MAETVNIGRMAEIISDTLFSEFLWKKIGPTNENWTCEQPETHGVKTHPTDVVFYYDEPYSTTRRYIQCDLKSYGKSSITKTAIKGAVISLAKQIACAAISDEWQSSYTHNDCTPEISGLLFVYNHDTNYDAGFDTLLSDLRQDDIVINSNARLYIMGPDDINWLDRVAREIRQMRGIHDDELKLPSRERCSFYYPQLVRQTNFQQARAATLEMLTSPWIIMQYLDEDDTRQGIVIFHKRKTSVEGLMYIIDYLRHYQLFERKLRIIIKVPAEDTKASMTLQKAIQQYLGSVSTNNDDSEFAKRLEKISLSSIPEMLTSYSTEEIGMEYAG
ncbi:hypothetical protein [Phyllobacterium sp. YR531]|uniref:hypothetical protein n=1 Tax=Phyllobacterium sp. YR531 TaxID=1144343 RepID=UPI00026F9879|nr:hypothetical protein [Phyllobacterium sp. YR531]EJN05351.1 hypothetical protein PMI41_01136 [Phyllobacterium sp. YR531]